MREHPSEDKTALTIPPPPNLERVRVVLVEPRTAVNVGAAARAMSTMGLRDLAQVQYLGSSERLVHDGSAHGVPSRPVMRLGLITVRGDETKSRKLRPRIGEKSGNSSCSQPSAR